MSRAEESTPPHAELLKALRAPNSPYKKVGVLREFHNSAADVIEHLAAALATQSETAAPVGEGVWNESTQRSDCAMLDLSNDKQCDYPRANALWESDDCHNLGKWFELCVRLERELADARAAAALHENAASHCAQMVVDALPSAGVALSEPVPCAGAAFVCSVCNEAAEAHRDIVAVKPGWCSVPIEPTQAMLDAGNAADYAATSHRSAGTVWRAMLSAVRGEMPSATAAPSDQAKMLAVQVLGSYTAADVPFDALDHNAQRAITLAQEIIRISDRSSAK